MKDSTFITRVALRNYKSIAACDGQLRPVMFRLALTARVSATSSTLCSSLPMFYIERKFMPRPTENHFKNE